MAFSSEKGAVTAEFMLITPALVLAVISLLGLFPLALTAIRLELVAMNLARAHSYGHEITAPDGFQFQLVHQGRISCIKVTADQLGLESEYCVIPVG